MCRQEYHFILNLVVWWQTSIYGMHHWEMKNWLSGLLASRLIIIEFFLIFPCHKKTCWSEKMVLGWRQWWMSTLWHLNWLQRLLPLFSLPVLYLHKQFSDFQLLLLQISNRRSRRRAISSPIWCCVHRSLTSSQTCRDHYQQRRKKFTRKKTSPLSTKSTVDKKEWQ